MKKIKKINLNKLQVNFLLKIIIFLFLFNKTIFGIINKRAKITLIEPNLQ